MPNFTDIYEGEEFVDSLVCAYFEHVLKVQSPIEPKTRLPKQMIPEFEDDKDFFFYVSDLLKKQLAHGMHEGGILDEHLRDKKFDVIVGNPPYTQMTKKNKLNRRYSAYPKHNDMAQIFVHWAFDHLEKDGVIGYNIIDTWLNAKTDSNSKETRFLVYSKIKEIIHKDVKKYSIGDGGRITTFIICIADEESSQFAYDNEYIEFDKDKFFKAGFLDNSDEVEYEYHSAKISKYVTGKHVIKSAGRFNKDGADWDDVTVVGDSCRYLIFQRQLSDKDGMQKQLDFKLVRCTDIVDNFRCGSAGAAEAKSICFDMPDVATFMFGFFNTNLARSYFRVWAKFKTDKTEKWWVYQFNDNVFNANCRVPDFDYYKQNRPERFEKYMKWIEENMHDKDKFLAGIDAEFEALISE